MESKPDDDKPSLAQEEKTKNSQSTPRKSNAAAAEPDSSKKSGASAESKSSQESESKVAEPESSTKSEKKTSEPDSSPKSDAEAAEPESSPQSEAKVAEPESSPQSEAMAPEPEPSPQSEAKAAEPESSPQSEEATAKSESSTEAAQSEGESPKSSDVVPAHHTPKILAEVLDEPVPPSDGKDTFRHPMYMDALVAIGLLVAMAGFTVGVIKIYITHTAKTYINERHYKEAIVLLAGAPLPGWFAVEGESPEELLNQALYLDGMEKLDLDYNDLAAIKELEKIKPGSRFFELANDVLREHAPQSDITLQGAAEHEATPSEARSDENKPILPEESN